jgi:DNA gyrase subunit A
MEVGLVRQVDIDSEMRSAYLDYAMSVIVSRALPDARDGLKPVHRRILFAMYDMGMRPDSPYRKSARIVGEVLGKYHPHGDMAVYDAMVRMAQDFSMRYPLIDGQGNFGSIDGDSAAAMRYTEARMFPAGLDLLSDIDRQTVDFVENFDGSLSEPSVLPASIPNLLVNGSSGIAVGMSTSVPPHNIGEICDALKFMLENWDRLDDVGLPELMQFVKGPDFPTGGLVFRYSDDGSDCFAQSYGTGRSKLLVQAKAHIEELDRSRNRIIVTELPYQVSKTTLIERIAELVRDRKLEGITDLRDESDRQGLRIVVDLTRTVEPRDILNSLYRMTPLRATFSVIMLALVDGEPRMLSLKQALRVYLEHRFVVIRRRSEHDFERARERAHILLGYLIALDNLDAVISLIRKSRTVDTARDNLRREFKLSEAQAIAILDMPLRRLATLERRRIEDEFKEKQELITYLERLLKDARMIREVADQELDAIKGAYRDPRRTTIIDGRVGSAVTVTDLLPDEPVWIVLTESGLVSRTFDEQAPKFTGVLRDPPRSIMYARPGDTLYVFTSDGMAATLPVHQIAATQDFGEGQHFSSVLPLSRDQEIVATISRDSDPAKRFLFLTTQNGTIKRIDSTELPGNSAHSFPVMLLDNDTLGWAEWSRGDNEVIMVSASGMAIRFAEETVRPMGLRAAGVRGMKLNTSPDRIVGMSIVEPKAHLWTITSNGIAKSTPISDFPVQGRYGQGVIAFKLKDNAFPLAASAMGVLDDNMVVVTAKGKSKYMRLGLAPRMGRNAFGDSVIAIAEKDMVIRVVILPTHQG